MTNSQPQRGSPITTNLGTDTPRYLVALASEK
jgi:hypothetical protein